MEATTAEHSSLILWIEDGSTVSTPHLYASYSWLALNFSPLIHPKNKKSPLPSQDLYGILILLNQIICSILFSLNLREHIHPIHPLFHQVIKLNVLFQV